MRLAAIAFMLLYGASAVRATRASAQDSAATADSSRPHIRVIAMVERGQYGIAFEPMRTHGMPGDTIRFIQKGALPHNVLFRSAPDGANLGPSLESPMLTDPGAIWDLVLDARFVPGKYHFVCVPHETMGMAGLLYVDAAPPGP